MGHVATSPARWWPWPVAAQHVAYESLDISLLFTIRQSGWIRRHTVVLDADAVPVASIRGQYVLGRGDRFVAYRRPESHVFLGRDSSEVACWRPDGGGTLIDFAECLREEPFAKMGILGAVLAAH